MCRMMMGGVVLLTTVACQDAGSRVTGVAHRLVATAPAEVVSAAGGSARLWAHVSANGTLLGSRGGTGATRLGPGQYEVTFNRDVSPCAYVSTTHNAYSQAIQSYTAGGHLSTQGVYVETKNQGGGLTDGPFDLVVSCGSDSFSYAVVDYSGNLARSSGGVSVNHSFPGAFFITFPSTQASCAYLATVGDPGNALVYTPMGVYTGSGPNANTIYVETKNPAGGLQDAPFHLISICANSPSARIAVVTGSGDVSRKSPGTTVQQPSVGEFVINSNIATANCATVATRGSINTAVPYSPATVEVVPGGSSNAIGIETRSLLFFGGALANVAFHVASVCS